MPSPTWRLNGSHRRTRPPAPRVATTPPMHERKAAPRPTGRSVKSERPSATPATQDKRGHCAPKSTGRVVLLSGDDNAIADAFKTIRELICDISSNVGRWGGGRRPTETDSMRLGIS